MRIRIQPISPVQNRDFGKKKELSKGEARVNTRRVAVYSKEVVDNRSLNQLLGPPEEATIEILWHDDETIARYRQCIFEHPDLELVE